MLPQLNALTSPSGRTGASGQVLYAGREFRNKDFRHWGFYVTQTVPLLPTATVGAPFPAVITAQLQVSGRLQPYGAGVVRHSKLHDCLVASQKGCSRAWACMSTQSLFVLTACAGA